MMTLNIFKKIKYKRHKTDYVINQNSDIYNEKTNEEIKQFNGDRGYKFCVLIIDGERHMFPVHRLVAEAFCKKKKTKNKNHIDHIDANKHNNHYDNLEYVTSKENHKRAAKKGLYLTGINHKMNKYSEEQIHHVCKLLENRDNSYVMIEKETGVNFHTIYRIAKNEKWIAISKNYDFSKRFKRNYKMDKKSYKKIIKLINKGMKTKTISELMNIPVSTIRGIKNGEHYKDYMNK